MCGLIGALLGEPSLTDERIAGALGTISHRGPDHTGWWCSSDRRTVLGHVRLSIIGLDNGDQPLVSAGGEVRCVVNGELYGYRAIRSALKGEGRHFASDSDSEIALHLYEKLGGDFVHHLRGEFAVVIADQRRRCLIAVRDRFGIKPLFYTVQGGDVLVASEIKALLALGAPARWDAAAFFAECHYVRAADRTLFAGIRAVPPGCTLVARDGQVEVRPTGTPTTPAERRLSPTRSGTRRPWFSTLTASPSSCCPVPVEGRVPFLDHQVAECAARIPVHHKIRGMREKHVLREAVRDCVLPEVYDRQKHPFMSPPARDSGDALAAFCQDTLRSRSVDDQPFFDPRRIRGLMDKVATMEPADRAAFEGVVLRIVSTCILQQRFGLAA